MKYFLIIVLAFITAAVSAYLSNCKTALENVTFNLDLFDREGESGAVESSIEHYNKYSASLYNTGGYLEGLGAIPAAPLLKRRLFKDINMLKGEKMIMVFDKDTVDIERIYFENRETAFAETKEVWFISLQEKDTRKPLFNVKSSVVKARYLLHREPFPLPRDEEKWVVYEVDVYPGDEKVPELNVRPVL